MHDENVFAQMREHGRIYAAARLPICMQLPANVIVQYGPSHASPVDGPYAKPSGENTPAGGYPPNERAQAPMHGIGRPIPTTF